MIDHRFYYFSLTYNDIQIGYGMTQSNLYIQIEQKRAHSD